LSGGRATGIVLETLAADPAVAGVAVDEGAAALTAAVRLREEAVGAATSPEERAATWAAVFDDAYAAELSDGADADTATWRSSVTGERLGPAEMAEWAAATTARVLACAPRRVLEVGCGTGTLVRRLAPHCERYVATDVSRVALDVIREAVARGGLDNVAVEERWAHDLAGVTGGPFDCVILNSVVQYFPSTAYLAAVLTQACDLVRARAGTVFVGDVRPLRLSEALWAEVELAAADDGDPASAVANRVDARARTENELLLEPGWFGGFAATAPPFRVVAAVKRGRRANELTRYRYDVLLTARGQDDPPTLAEVEANPARVADAVSAALARGAAAVRVEGLENARVSGSLAALDALRAAAGGERVGTVRRRLGRAPGVDPEDLFEIADRLRAGVGVGPSGARSGGEVSARFRREGTRSPSRVGIPVAPPAAGTGAVANDPLTAEVTRRYAATLRRRADAALRAAGCAPVPVEVVVRQAPSAAGAG
jgi:SAM-dependent methyltransferase